MAVLTSLQVTTDIGETNPFLYDKADRSRVQSEHNCIFAFPFMTSQRLAAEGAHFYNYVMYATHALRVFLRAD